MILPTDVLSTWDEFFNDFGDRRAENRRKMKLLHRIGSLDAVETDECYVYSVDVPGCGIENLSVTVEEKVVKVRGERKDKASENTYEYYFTAKSDADLSTLEAELHNGVLNLKVRKRKEKPVNKTVEIKYVK